MNVGLTGALAVNAYQNLITYIDDSDRTLKIYGWDGKKWVRQAKDYLIGGTGKIRFANMGEFGLAIADSDTDILSFKQFSGASWGQIGTGDEVTGMGSPMLTKLTTTDIALTHTGANKLQAYRWNPLTSSWGTLGNSYSTTWITSPRATSLTSSVIVLLEPFMTSMQAFYFDGTNWSTQGSSIIKNYMGSGSTVTALTSTTVALINNGTRELQTNTFNGSSWSATGSVYNMHASMDYACCCTLNNTDIAVIDNGTDTLYTMRFNGSTWSQVGSSLSITGADDAPYIETIF